MQTKAKTWTQGRCMPAIHGVSNSAIAAPHGMHRRGPGCVSKETRLPVAQAPVSVHFERAAATGIPRALSDLLRRACNQRSRPPPPTPSVRMADGRVSPCWYVCCVHKAVSQSSRTDRAQATLVKVAETVVRA